MPQYDTPGVYFERADASSGGVAALRTDIAALVGIAQRGPLGIAVPIESQRQFNAWFGDTIDNGYLAYCARAFFENGGRRLWAVRVGSGVAARAALTVADTGGPAWRIEASSEGVWGNDLALRLVEVRRVQTRARLDAYRPLALAVDNCAGLTRHALVELSQPGATPARARVDAIDPVAGVLTLDRAPVGFDPGGSLRLETLAYTLELYDAGRLLAVYPDLALVPEHPRYGPQVLKQPWQSIDLRAPDLDQARAPESDLAVDYFRVARNRAAPPPPPIVIRELRDATRRALLAPLVDCAGAAPSTPRALIGGADGLAALQPADFIGAALSPQASALELAAGRRGIAALAPVDEVALVAVPDIHIQPREPNRYLPPPPCAADPCRPQPLLPAAAPARAVGDLPPRFDLEAIYLVQAALVAHCERQRDRIALLDAPFDTCNRLSFAVAELRAWRARFDSRFAALYAPWVKVVDPLLGRGRTRAIPPSGHVAGQAAASDLRSGAHRAPANVALNWVQDVSLTLDEARHGLLNTLGVNLLRTQSGRGVRVLGARTLSSDPDWRFVNVRRLMSMIEKAIDTAIQWSVFEPNDWRTRAKLRLVIVSFLRALWERGALTGASEEEAFFVRCDDGNNPAAARDRGWLLIEVGIAPSVPFEFIVLRIGREANGFAIAYGEPLAA